MFDKTKFSWTEPWLWSMRNRPLKGWGVFLALELAGFLALFTLFVFVGPNPVDWANCLFMGSLGFFAVFALVEGNLLCRDIRLEPSGIFVDGGLGKYEVSKHYSVSEIDRVQIFSSEETGRRDPMMLIHFEGDAVGVGITSRVHLRRLAHALHDLRIDVVFEGWDPSEPSLFEKTFAFQSEVAPAGSASLGSVGEDEPKLMTIGGIVSAACVVLWPFVWWLCGTGLFAMHSYRNWQQMGNLPFYGGLVAIALIFFLAVFYFSMIGAAVSSKILVRGCRDQVDARSKALFAGSDLRSIPIEVLDREYADKIVQKIRDLGLLLVQPRSRELLFEGKAERWRIPFDAISTCKVEEFEVGTPGDTVTAAMNYYVVMNVREGSETSELVMRSDDRQLGEFNDTTKAENAAMLFEQIVDALNGVPSAG